MAGRSVDVSRAEAGCGGDAPASSSNDDDPTIELDAAVVQAVESHLWVGLAEWQCPVVFHEGYDVHLFGVERFHPFDAAKWGRVYAMLCDWNLISDRSTVRPVAASRKDLLVAHSEKYLNSIRYSCKIAQIFEMPYVCMIPYCLLDRMVLKAMRLQTGGTVAACRLALERNWAINIGGGFHHASRHRGGGFCVYADISLAVRLLLALALVKKVLILDLDAHQGNGHERDFTDDPRVFIVDMFNPCVYPDDRIAQRAISRAVPVKSGCGDEEYLSQLEQNVDAALGEYLADLIVYNAGTDGLEGDPLGRLGLSREPPLVDQVIARRVKQAKTQEEREQLFNDLKKTPHLFSAFLKMRNANQMDNQQWGAGGSGGQQPGGMFPPGQPGQQPRGPGGQFAPMGGAQPQWAQGGPAQQHMRPPGAPPQGQFPARSPGMMPGQPGQGMMPPHLIHSFMTSYL